MTSGRLEMADDNNVPNPKRKASIKKKGRFSVFEEGGEGGETPSNQTTPGCSKRKKKLLKKPVVLLDAPKLQKRARKTSRRSKPHHNNTEGSWVPGSLVSSSCVFGKRAFMVESGDDDGKNATFVCDDDEEEEEEDEKSTLRSERRPSRIFKKGKFTIEDYEGASTSHTPCPPPDLSTVVFTRWKRPEETNLVSPTFKSPPHLSYVFKRGKFTVEDTFEDKTAPRQNISTVAFHSRSCDSRHLMDTSSSCTDDTTLESENSNPIEPQTFPDGTASMNRFYENDEAHSMDVMSTPSSGDIHDSSGGGAGGGGYEHTTESFLPDLSTISPCPSTPSVTASATPSVCSSAPISPANSTSSCSTLDGTTTAVAGGGSIAGGGGEGVVANGDHFISWDCFNEKKGGGGGGDDGYQAGAPVMAVTGVTDLSQPSLTHSSSVPGFEDQHLSYFSRSSSTSSLFDDSM